MEAFAKVIRPGLKGFRRIEIVCLVIPMAVLIALIFIQILFRIVGLKGFSWLEEFSRYIFVFSTFLGASIAIDVDAHPKMTAVLIAVPRIPKYILLIAGDVICCFTCFCVAYYGFIQITKQIASGAMSTALPIPMYIPYLIIPIGLFTSAIRYMASLVKNTVNLCTGRDLKEEKEGGAES